MAAETDDQEVRPKFSLQGIEYELPQLTECDMDEWMLVYKYARVTLSDTVQCDDTDDEEARVEKLSQPGLWRALFHIAYRRANPKKTDAAIEAIVGKIDFLQTMAEIGSQVPEEEDENPTSAPKPETPSEPSSASSSKSLSLASLPSSETPEDQPVPTGTSG